MGARHKIARMCGSIPLGTQNNPGILPQRFNLKDRRSCLLRDMVEDDAEELCALLPKMHAESDFLNYLPGEFKMTIEQERQFIREHNAKPCSISMVALVEGRIVGVAGAYALEFKRFAHHAELGLVVLEEFRGQGMGRKMMEIVLEWGRRQGLRKMYLSVYDGNDRAITLYQSLGFVEEARLRGHVRRGDGTYGDSITMARDYVEGQ